MNIRVCIKRVPFPGAKFLLTEDEQEINTRNLSFTIGPHEECALEEAVQLTEQYGGESTVLTLGPAESHEQLRDALAMGVHNAILLQTDGQEWNAIATALAIADTVCGLRDQGHNFDVLLFGNDAADTGGSQVGIRVAHALDMPCVTGIKALEIADGIGEARREASGGWEVFKVSLPAVFTVKEGINLPRFRTMPGRLKAKRAPILTIDPQWSADGFTKVRLKNTPEQSTQVEILKDAQQASLRVAEILREMQLL